VDRSDQFDQFILRETTVYAAGEALELAPIPIVDVIQGSSTTLSGAYLGLQVGRTVVVTGERDDLRGVTVSEAMTLADVTLDEGFTTLTFEVGLLYPYVRSTVTLNANVALATHGETRSEVLGGGDAGQVFQRLTLRQPPLTYTSAPTPSGGVSTLEVRVNDQLYQEVPTLYGHGPTERIYITRTDDDGKTAVQFGDGKTGARLPTGQNNVMAAYRQGIGSAGLVRAGQLGLLMTRPLGVREVTNPLDATGAADPESGDDIRKNAALTLRTLDRIVSLQDYEDFARAFSGITKALATWTWNGQQSGVLITVAGPGAALVAEGTMLYDNLVNAIRSFGDPFIPLSVATYRPAFFKVSAKVKIAFGYTQETVLQAVQDRLRNAFSFAARNFGQPVVLSEVIAEMQDVAGIDALTVTQLYRLDDDPTASLQAQLVADPPRTAIAQATLGAELLTLDPAPLADIGVMP
jgi:predicted phage baseplate assembly protein